MISLFYKYLRLHRFQEWSIDNSAYELPVYTKIKYLLYLELSWQNKKLSLKIQKIFSRYEKTNKMSYQEIMIN
jgi:hypothetical protein